jgi:hypothetical protein
VPSDYKPHVRRESVTERAKERLRTSACIVAVTVGFLALPNGSVVGTGGLDRLLTRDQIGAQQGDSSFYDRSGLGASQG